VLAAFRALLAGVVRDETFGNGRYARNVLEAAIGRHAWRLRDVEQPTIDQLRDLAPQDLVDPPVEPAPAEEAVPAAEEPAASATVDTGESVGQDANAAGGERP
jgi:hypothetical protein